MANIVTRSTHLCERRLSDAQYDCDAWSRYPHHRWLFNKLDLSLKLGYNAGPGGTSVPVNGDYIVRPIMNLSGMGVGAKRVHLSRDDYKTVPPGYFWCEYFQGPHMTIDYEWQLVDGQTILRPIFAAQGYRTDKELYRFNAWKQKTPPLYHLPYWIQELSNVPRFNVEFINGQITEIHLRTNPNFPPNSTDIIPRWSDMTDDECEIFERLGFQYQTAFEDADGHLEIKRLGFYYK